MLFTLSLASVFALIAGIAAALLAVTLLASQKAGAAWLAGFSAVFSFALLSSAALPSELPVFVEQTLNWLKFTSLLAMPFLHQYARLAIRTHGGGLALHLVPAGLFALFLLPPISAFISEPLLQSALYLIQNLQVILYLAVILYTVKRYRRRLKQQYSAISDIDLGWLQRLSAGLLLLIVADFTLFPALGALGLPRLTIQLCFNLILTLYILWLARSALYQHFVRVLAIEPPPRYEKSGLDADSAVVIAGDVKKLMQDQKLYLQANLVLADLSAAAGTSNHLLSEVLNTALGQSFYDFVNSHRVAAAQQILRDTNRPILEIAFAVGFNNKVSFNQAFKKFARVTPSVYRQSRPNKNR